MAVMAVGAHKKHWQSVSMILIANALFMGATKGGRTPDLFVTNEMLYRLSYCGLFAGANIVIILLTAKFDG